MKKITLMLALLLTVSIGAFSQLSTREVSAVSVPLGNRPQAGDAALQFVFPLINLSAHDGEEAGLYSGNFFGSGDMLTFKYYNTEDVVIRAAIRLFNNNTKLKGAESDSSFYNTVIPDGVVTEFVGNSTSREYNLAGGLEKHYSATNFFDVYVGAEGLVGFGKDQTVNEATMSNGDFAKRTEATKTNIVGVAGVVGFNMFVAELPVSIGLEYGLSAKWIFGGTTKVTREDKIGSDNHDTEYFTDGTSTDQYSDLKKREFNMDTNNNIRINIHIYFSTFRK